jgi:hypothetical protein
MRLRAAAWVVCWCARAAAQPAPDRGSDALHVSAESETHLRLFQRALLPGAAGAIVRSHTLLPVTEYVSLRARDGELDAELRAWGTATLGELEAERRLDGDLQTASVRYGSGASWIRLGRQQFAGGAARYSRFDGAAAAVGTDAGVGLEAYGGFVVLPRWSADTYHQLGSAADLRRNPDALPEPSRSDHWLAGGRLSYAGERFGAGLSVHEQHEREGLARRNLGADATAELSPVRLGGSAIVDVDATDLAEARAWAEATPLEPLDVGLELEHVEPALLLSRQSVLAVFSTDRYDELGARAAWRASRSIGLEAAGFGQAFSDGSTGARGELSARAALDRGERTVVRVAYSRVLAPDNGYHALRDALRRELTRDLVGTAEAWVYLYDDSILGHRSSIVGAATLQWWFLPQASVLWGASLARSPHAAADAQTQVRLSWSLAREIRR